MKSQGKSKKNSPKNTNIEIKPVAPTPTPSIPPPSLAQKIWEQIKYIELPIFGLPNQTIEKHCSPIFIEPEKLYLSYKIGIIFPMMEETLKNRFIIELSDKYLTVAPIVKGK